MYSWIFLVLFYGVAKGLRDAFKKKALQKNSLLEVLFFYTFLSFIFALPFSSDAFDLNPIFHPALIFKSFVIFLSWMFSFRAIKHLPVSLVGVLDSSRIVFSMFMGSILFGEKMTFFRTLSMFLIMAGLFLLRLGHKDASKKADTKYILLSFASCLLTATSGLLDKVLLTSSSDIHSFFFKDAVITSSQTQFWYLLYLTLFYGLYIVFTKTKISVRSCAKNYWIILLAVLFVAADRALFTANSNPQSKVTIMTLIKQSSVIVTLILGKFMFREKDILRRFICAFIITLGVVLSVF